MLRKLTVADSEVAGGPDDQLLPITYTTLTDCPIRQPNAAPINPEPAVWFRARAPRQYLRQLRRKSRSMGGSKVAAIWPLMKSAGWPNVERHKFLPLTVVVTAVRSAHQSAFLRPVYYFWDDAFG